MTMSSEEIKALKTPEYWDERYSQHQVSAQETTEPSHEWFRTYSDLQPFFQKHLFEKYTPASHPHILHLGAGDSTVPFDLLAEGYTTQTCLDFSLIVVQQMSSKTTFNNSQKGLTWLHGDVRSMPPTLSSSSIDIAFDKGTLDAMIHGSPWDPPEDVRDDARRYMREVSRVLKPTGCFLYITYRQPHFVKPLLNAEKLWNLECETLGGEGTTFEYFGFVMRKKEQQGARGVGSEAERRG